jgi:SAM-dependent methyltransferase
VTSAAEQWRAELAAWRIDDAILAAAPETPYGFPPALFRPDARDSAGPLQASARAALPDGGTVLDVGCGGGAASVPLVPPAAVLVGVDEAASMLTEFRASAGAAGASVRTVQGRWPDVAADVPSADVVVCAHVAYNVGDLVPFAAALTSHARNRVVLELHAEHPWVPLGPLWQRVHHQPRPDGPTSDLAIAVLRDAGIDPTVEEWVRPAPDLRAPEVREALVAFTRRRLCLTPDRDAEVAALLAEFPPPARRSVVMSWRP